MAVKKFRARGLRSNYDPKGRHLDFIYFATDTHEILVNDQVYGLSEEQLSTLEAAFDTVVFDVRNSKLIFTAIDDTSQEIILPKVVASDASIKVDAATADEDYRLSLQIDPSDSILSKSDSGVLSNIGLNWNKASKKVELTGRGSKVIASIDATDFVKDGILSSATLEVNPSGQPTGTYIHFVFNADAAKQDIYVNVTSLIDVYTAGNGLQLTGKQFNVKLDPASEKDSQATPTDFLVVTATGTKVQGIKSEITRQIIPIKDQINAYTVNKKRIDTNPELDGRDIKATGYVKGTDFSDITEADTINTALSKLEKQIEKSAEWYKV